MSTSNEALKLENQLCFPIYAVSRLITQLYQPLLSKWGITYTQYLVFLLLWEKDQRTVTEIGRCLLLETSTLTPLLKRLEAKEYIRRHRSEKDERTVLIQLTEKGKALKRKAAKVPELIVGQVQHDTISLQDIRHLKSTLEEIRQSLSR